MTTLKQTFETDIDDNTDLTQSYMDKINKSFFTMLKDPTEKEIEKHRKIRDALIAAWLASFFKDFEEQLYKSAQKGIDEADRQLKAKNIKEVKDKSITADTFENQVKNRYAAASEDVILISQNIKINSESSIKTLSESLQGKINKEAWKTLSDVIDKNVTFYKDRADRKWDIVEYIHMKTMTETISAERLSFFTRAIQYGVDLVRIVHLNLHPTCELCAPFENKILSITGSTEGYMSIDGASMYGLFHPRCDHIPEQLELAPEDSGKDGIINLREANKKRYAYNNQQSIYQGIKDKFKMPEQEVLKYTNIKSNKDTSLPKLDDNKVVLKQNIKERNNLRHPDLTDEDKKNALSALYDNDLILQDKNKTNYYHYIKYAQDTNYVVLLDKSKENFEIVHYHKINNKNLEKLIKKNEQ